MNGGSSGTNNNIKSGGGRFYPCSERFRIKQFVQVTWGERETKGPKVRKKRVRRMKIGYTNYFIINIIKDHAG